MPFDYEAADQLVRLSFAKLNKRTASMEFPEPGTLSKHLTNLIDNANSTGFTLSHQHCQLLASAGVEMWHRSIHSFLWSMALTDKSPMWASVSGYYASHFVMRAFAHSMGILKSFMLGKAIQIIAVNGQFACTLIPTKHGEHSFYWNFVKGHPKLAQNPLFRQNSERDPRSDSAHRNFANYTDHVDSFVPIGFPELDSIIEGVEKISRIRLHSVTEPSRENFPDLQNVQILAFQRIVAFHDFLEVQLSSNRFWQAHRRPSWCKDVMLFQVRDQGVEAPSQE